MCTMTDITEFIFQGVDAIMQNSSIEEEAVSLFRSNSLWCREFLVNV